MPAWHLRDYHDDDLDQAIEVWDQSRRADEDRVFPVSEVMAAAKAGQPAVVAVVGSEVVGMAVAQAHGKRGWILQVALASRWRERGIGSALLGELERRLRALGVRHISALLPAGAAGTKALENSGYQVRTDLAYYEKLEPSGTANTDVLAALGGRVLPEGLWDAMAGMEREKQVVERRLVLPLSEPTLADHYGVAPPKAVILFGPPGTGKTSFAKAVASRLGWPFVELFPSRLAADTNEGLATALRETFADLAELDSVLLFIDEVEEIAGERSGKAVDPGHGVTNELLKLIPVFREPDARLLACATNSVRSLDAAFLRPGRFDYVIPIGPPDPTARAAIWARYLGASARSVNLGQLVEASELFTPADIEFAARKGAQAAFEREIAQRQGLPATTEDYMTAIGDTRPSLTARAIQEFAEDIDEYSRL
ncbi:AAA family ATPase [Streptomyces pluripotens]|uniref:AAA family ATPase n=1 Tax=Streptomyces pluripotens TaxID=1355015 RepID=A0A221P242_9ACTN|nr:AAA family ATPase [Streptomyces pluripotens]ASN26247.1 AAA family ATPase [Streptomyces pluripotens]KIE26414.1 ATPase AAA [Streptomyces sp. MUSC 125]MCH0560740.1 GNAT family N-acetyltransferase [Streptomyces sp. MUM 16J]